jgi:hypothetical protein
MRIINLRNNAVLADKARMADTFWGRLLGLLNRRSLEKGEALILRPSNSVHSLFMRFTIDILFLDKKDKVIAILSSFRPFRFSPIYFNAHLTIELPENTLRLTQTQLGDIIKID